MRSWFHNVLPLSSHLIRFLLYLLVLPLTQPTTSRWFGPGHIGRDFRPRHALLTLHIWLLHKRLISDHDDPETALMIQEELFNILWDDTTCRIRQQGISEMLVNKHLLQVQQYTFLNLTHYDHAYTEFLDRPCT